MSRAQLDIFDLDAGLLPAKPSPGRGDPDRVRRRLKSVLSELRGAQTLPWDHATLRYHQTVVPQMTRWLPEDEAERVKSEFAAELARLS